MTLKQIEAFYLAARLGTFALAAARIHVAQSSLSKRIAELESYLGQQLFDRSTKRARLTAAGEALMPKARAMLDLAHTMRAGVDEAATAAGTINLGISELAATTWFPGFLERHRKQYPNVHIRPQVGLSRSIERQIERGELDCAVSAGAPLSEHLAFDAVASLEFAWMISPRLADGARVIDVRSFARYPVISSTADSGLNLILHSWVTSHGVQLRQGVTCNSMTAIIALTVAGVGISFMPYDYMKPIIRNKLLLALRSKPALPLVRYYLLWRKDDSRQVLQAVAHALRKQVNFAIPNPLWVR